MNPYINKITGGPVQEQDELEQGAPPAPGGGEPPVEPPVPPEGGGEGGEGDENLEEWQQRMLEQIHARFVQERVEGFTSPEGQAYPPVPVEQAEQRWLRVRPRFLAALNSPEIRQRFDPAMAGAAGAMGRPQGGPARQRPQAGEMCPCCGQIVQQAAPEPEAAPAAEVEPAGELPPEPPVEAAPPAEEAPEPAPEPAPEEEEEEPQPRLPESARRAARMAKSKLDE